MVNFEKGIKPMRGCTRKQRGPWLVRRATKKGAVHSLRFPSENERQKNLMRERRRRMITRNIYAGLRAHGKYNLPKNADNNLLLMALCEEAGWRVEEDGTICRKELKANEDATREKNCDKIHHHFHGLTITKIENCGGNEKNTVNLTLSL